MVLNALRWLKIHNKHYRNIVLDESRLDWIEGKNKSQSLNIENKTIFCEDVEYAEGYDDKSFFNTETQEAEKVLKTLNDINYNGRDVNVEITEEKGRNRNRGRGRDRKKGGSRRNDKKGGNRAERRSGRRSDFKGSKKGNVGSSRPRKNRRK